MIHCMNHEINKALRKYECPWQRIHPARNFGKSSRRTTLILLKIRLSFGQRLLVMIFYLFNVVFVGENNNNFILQPRSRRDQKILSKAVTPSPYKGKNAARIKARPQTSLALYNKQADTFDVGTHFSRPSSAFGSSRETSTNVHKITR